jgi:hypothetical protein
VAFVLIQVASVVAQRSPRLALRVSIDNDSSLPIQHLRARRSRFGLGDHSTPDDVIEPPVMHRYFERRFERPRQLNVVQRRFLEPVY